MKKVFWFASILLVCFIIFIIIYQTPYDFLNRDYPTHFLGGYWLEKEISSATEAGEDYKDSSIANIKISKKRIVFGKDKYKVEVKINDILYSTNEYILMTSHKKYKEIYLIKITSNEGHLDSKRLALKFSNDYSKVFMIIIEGSSALDYAGPANTIKGANEAVKNLFK